MASDPGTPLDGTIDWTDIWEVGGNPKVELRKGIDGGLLETGSSGQSVGRSGHPTGCG